MCEGDDHKDIINTSICVFTLTHTGTRTHVGTATRCYTLFQQVFTISSMHAFSHKCCFTPTHMHTPLHKPLDMSLHICIYTHSFPHMLLHTCISYAYTCFYTGTLTRTQHALLHEPQEHLCTRALLHKPSHTHMMRQLFTLDPYFLRNAVREKKKHKFAGDHHFVRKVFVGTNPSLKKEKI